MVRINKEMDSKINEYILNAIDFSDYKNIKATTEKEKLTELFKIFKSEYGFNINRLGLENAFKEWIMGLPNVFNIDFENYKIIEFAEKIGSIKPNANDNEQYKILDNWFNMITNKTFKLMKRIK